MGALCCCEDKSGALDDNYANIPEDEQSAKATKTKHKIEDLKKIRESEGNRLITNDEL
jgi:hypothetical protein